MVASHLKNREIREKTWEIFLMKKSGKLRKKTIKVRELRCFRKCLKVRGPFVQTLCIEKDSYMDAI